MSNSSAARKPIHRPRNILLLLLALGCGWIGWSVYQAVTATPGAAVDYQQKLLELVESYQKGTEGTPNGWPVFLDTIERLNAVEKKVTGAAGGLDAKPAEWSPNYSWPFDYSAVRDSRAPKQVRDQTVLMMDALRAGGVFEGLESIAASPRMIRPKQTGDIIGVLIPELGKSRQLARLGGARMWLAHRTGDNAELVASFEQTLALSRVCSSQGFLIDRLVGVAIASLALGELRNEMVESPPDAPTCRGLLAAMDRQLGHLPPDALVFEGERISTLDTIQWTHTDDGHGSGRLILTKLTSGMSGDFDMSGATGVPSHLSQASIINVASVFFPSKAETTRVANEFYDNVVALTQPGAPMPGKGGAFDPEKFAESLPRGQMVLKIVIPAIGKALMSMGMSRGEIAGTRAMLAVEAYRAERGDYPATLADLVPSVVASVPVDAHTGKPYGYKRFAAREDPLGRSYLLYSIGADGTDDGGTPAKNVEALTGTAKGTDFIFNAPRE